ncbi:hypothetical protein GCM10007161_17640 [Ignatzschineria indica]|uniref:SD-repeat containing protein B domain-containing protein n=1 Tax=Ignatzschineria indica TaxID=472583 RepID=A0A2U2AJ75_9GAMM|nr:hypothetical protein [Ignatzschineria indica]PWD82714.1 hypothetical protein DC082_08865 [Ignatzschineria indica]GGZ86307.1 hypothetical protein GCM10007161_17640 [Ignatzschineria indica]
MNFYQKQRRWEVIRPGVANVSHYIYHDINREGNYDLNAKPMMIVAVKMTRPDGSYRIRRSNINGFVNFINTIVDQSNSEVYNQIDVREPGEYTFEVQVPDGWYVTSGNAIQKITYVEAPNTRPGIICLETPTPVGLAQRVIVSGKVFKRVGGDLEKVVDQEVIVRAIFENGLSEKVELKDGRYSFDVGNYKGTMTLFFESDFGECARMIDVGIYPINLSATILGEASRDLQKSDVTVVDFEDITVAPIQKVPNGIAGVNWHNLIVCDNKLYNGEGYNNGCIDGSYVGYNTSGYPVTIELEEGFDFYGAYFSVAWLSSAEGETLSVEVWRGDQHVTKEEFTLSALGPFWLDAKWANVTKIVLSTKHYWQFVVDHIKIGV